MRYKNIILFFLLLVPLSLLYSQDTWEYSYDPFNLQDLPDEYWYVYHMYSIHKSNDNGYLLLGGWDYINLWKTNENGLVNSVDNIYNINQKLDYRLL